MRKAILVAMMLCAAGCEKNLAKWESPDRSVRVWRGDKAKYQITVWWECDTLPDTLKVAVPK